MGKGRDRVPSLWFWSFSSPGTPLALDTLSRRALAMSSILENTGEMLSVGLSSPPAMTLCGPTALWERPGGVSAAQRCHEAAAGSSRAARQSPPGDRTLLTFPAGPSLLHAFPHSSLGTLFPAAGQHELNPGINCQNQHGFLEKFSFRKKNKKEKWMETNSKHLR